MTTIGIHAVNGSEVNVNGYYNLSGQRMENPTKDLYVIRSAEGRLQGKNGKKVLVK